MSWRCILHKNSSSPFMHSTCEVYNLGLNKWFEQKQQPMILPSEMTTIYWRFYQIQLTGRHHVNSHYTFYSAFMHGQNLLPAHTVWINWQATTWVVTVREHRLLKQARCSLTRIIWQQTPTFLTCQRSKISNQARSLIAQVIYQALWLLQTAWQKTDLAEICPDSKTSQAQQFVVEIGLHPYNACLVVHTQV